MRRLTLAIALACVLSGAVRAGEMASTGVVAPPPPPSGSTTATGTSTTGAPAPQASSTVLTIIVTLITVVR